jgi:hypothetical protein
MLCTALPTLADSATYRGIANQIVEYPDHCHVSLVILCVIGLGSIFLSNFY